MEEKRKIIKTFDEGYQRIGKIWCEKNKCDICGKIKICICSDGSEDEYKYSAICPKCVTQACKEYHNKKNNIIKDKINIKKIKKILIEKIKKGPVSKEPSLPKLTHENLDYIENLRDEYVIAHDAWVVSDIRNWLAGSKIDENGNILIPNWERKKGMIKIKNSTVQWLAQYFNLN